MPMLQLTITSVLFIRVKVRRRITGRKLELASYYYNRSMVVNPAYVDGQNNRANLLKAYGIDVKVLPDSVINKY